MPALQVQTPRTGGQIVVDALLQHGTDTAFTVPGESFLPILDALHDAREAIRLIVCRHESPASHMSEAYGKLTGKPGICLVTRGPGATQASIGVHTASQDSTPMILLVGQVNSQYLGREAWQEIDVAGVFGSMAKWATQIERVQDIPAVLRQAFHIATSGRPGPVVIAIPEDILYQQAVVADLEPQPSVPAQASVVQLNALRAMLGRAVRPMVILGGSGWSPSTCDAMRHFIERFKLPVCTSFRRQDLFDNLHPQYAGSLGIGVADKLAQRVREADLILAFGTRLGETTTSEYQLLQAPRPVQTLIHVHSGAEELGRVYHADLAIHADMAAFAQALAQLKAPESMLWVESAKAAHRDYLQTLAPTPMPGMVNMAEVVTWLRQRLPADSIITNGAGNYTSWVHRFYAWRLPQTQLAPISGAMGYGVPAAIAAQVVYPQRTVVCFAGDGCFLMSGQELATVKQYKLPIVFIVVNNGMYGSIRMHQEINFPGKVFATDLENPDFVALAKAYGLHSALVERTQDFAAAFERAVNCGGAALLELRIDPQAITPRTTLAALRDKALRKS
jgi:acetolactate synthase I/II/III large subunit